MVTQVIVQSVSQLAAHRLVLYASSPQLQVFPLGRSFCDDAQELGLGKSDYKGPCLVLLQNCTATPKKLVAHVLGCFLRGYIVRIYWCDYISTSKSSFLCHLKDLVNAINELHELQDECQNISKITFRLQTFPRELSDWLMDKLPELEYAVHQFTHSLYAVETDGVIRFGIGKGEDMYLTPCDKDALFKGYVARACSKLEEALYVRKIQLLQDMVVLDVGAAPGAWTEFLIKHVHHVVAVDPGQLARNILGEQVTHICKKVQDASQELLSWTRERKFDLLVCDINKHPVEAAEIISPLLGFLRTGGSLVMTLKFYGRGKDKVQKTEEIKDMLVAMLEEMDCIWLLANSIYERTFVGVKK